MCLESLAWPLESLGFIPRTAQTGCGDACDHRGRQEGQMFMVIFGYTVSSCQLWMHDTKGEMR